MNTDSSKDIWSASHQLREEVKWYSEHLEERIKHFVQTLSDSHTRYLSGLEARLIFWLGAIAIVLCAFAGAFGVRDGLLVGALVVAILVITRVHLWTWLTWRQMNRVDRFRERFLELLDSINDVRWQTRPNETVAEDKAFLEKYKDMILFPSAVSDVRSAQVPWDSDVAHTVILYLEYRRSRHLHSWPDPSDHNSDTARQCALCTTADRVRKHIDGAISAYEAAIASARQELAAQIDKTSANGALDATAFLDDYSKLKAFYYVPEDLANEDEKLQAWLNSLCEKQRWTFDDADRVRELCRVRARGESHWLEPSEQEDRFDQFAGKLTQEMKNAATRCGLAGTWNWYDTAKQRQALNERSVRTIRRILGRHNPEAMFLELDEGPGLLLLDVWSDQNILLPGLERYGYDPKLVAKECKKAKQLMLKQRDESDRELSKEFQAMAALVRTQKRARH